MLTGVSAPQHSVGKNDTWHERPTPAFLHRMAVCCHAGTSAPPPAYEYLPFFYSRVFNLSWVFYVSAANPWHGGALCACVCAPCLPMLPHSAAPKPGATQPVPASRYFWTLAAESKGQWQERGHGHPTNGCGTHRVTHCRARPPRTPRRCTSVT